MIWERGEIEKEEREKKKRSGERREMRRGCVIGFMFFLLFCFGIASAHRIYVVHRIADIEVYAYFGGVGGGTPCRYADVEVYDDRGNLYVTGKTDENGKFRFSPETGVKTYKIVVKANLPGHQAETLLNLSGGYCDSSAEGAIGLPMRILAGFGYLMGIAGIAMLYKSRKATKAARHGDN